MSCVPGAGDLSTILQVLVQQQESLSNDSNEPDSRQLVLAQISHLNTSKTAVGSRAAAHRDIRRAIKQSSLSSRCATLSADQATIILRRHARRSAFTRNPEYSDWPVLEATAFFNDCFSPLLKPSQLSVREFRRPIMSCDSGNPLQAHPFIAMSLALRLQMVARSQSIMLDPGNPHTAPYLWQQFYYYMTKSLEAINDGLQIEVTGRTMDRIVNLFSAELMVVSPAWRAHAEGYITLLRLGGGIRKMLDTVVHHIAPMQFIARCCVMTNTTSPVGDQMLGAYALVAADLEYAYGTSLYPAFPCPTRLFVEIMAINRLRCRMFSHPEDPFIKPAAEAIFGRIANFTPTQWTEVYELPDIPVVPLVATMFKSATTLYAILALGPQAVPHSIPGLETIKLDVADPSKSLTKGCYTTLLRIIRRVQRELQEPRCLSWPLAVAGVAAASGSREEQEFIADALVQVTFEASAHYWPLKVRSTLQEFWASGNTTWEACYTKPVCPLS